MRKSAEELLEIESRKLEIQKARVKEMKKRVSSEARKKRDKKMIEMSGYISHKTGLPISDIDFEKFKQYIDKYADRMKTEIAVSDTSESTDKVDGSGQPEDVKPEKGKWYDQSTGVLTDGRYFYDTEKTPWFKADDGKWHAAGRDPKGFSEIEWERTKK